MGFRDLFSSSKRPADHAFDSKSSTGKGPPAEAPPSYSAAIASGPLAPPIGVARRPTLENTPDYSPLKAYDTVILIDDSGSMSGSNWQQTASALSGLVPVLTSNDTNGVDVYFLNNPKVQQGVRSANDVFNLFAETRPRGATPTGKRLGGILRAYMHEFKKSKGRNCKPLNVIVITDGSPSDPDLLESEIIRCAKELDKLKAKDRQVGIQFFQVGNDEGAAESLEELDNALSEENETRDMVDTVSFRSVAGVGNGLSAEGVLKVVLGAVDGSLDRKRLRAKRK